MEREEKLRCVTEEAKAEVLVANLEQLYHQYIRRKAADNTAKRNAGLIFFRWLSSMNPDFAEEKNQTFLDDVQSAVTLLCAQLAQLSQLQPIHSGFLADRAISLMMVAPATPRTITDRYLLVAEYQCEPLLAYLTQESLHTQYEHYLQKTPKRLMYPQQRKLCRKMEMLLKKKD